MKTNEEWRLWGDKDPLFGVASWSGRDKSGERPWTDADFYALGDDWLDFAVHWRRYGMPTGTVLEIGCGAGRITRRLTTDFSNVIACDVSKGMLNYAQTRVQAPNVKWLLSDGLLPAGDRSVDAVFSCHVLQHLPSNEAQLATFRDAYRVLTPGGSLLIHIHMHEFPLGSRSFSRVASTFYRGFLTISNIKATMKRFAMRFGGPPYMHGVSYRQSALYADLAAIGFTDVEFAAFPVRSNGALHTCVMARKAHNEP